MATWNHGTSFLSAHGHPPSIYFRPARHVALEALGAQKELKRHWMLLGAEKVDSARKKRNPYSGILKQTRADVSSQ